MSDFPITRIPGVPAVPRDWADDLTDVIASEVRLPVDTHDLIALRLRCVMQQGVALGIARAIDSFKAGRAS